MKCKVIYINELASLLHLSVAAVRGHLYRKNYNAVPEPFRMGCKLAWLIDAVDEWLAGKAGAGAALEPTSIKEAKKGRPTKTESLRRAKA